MVANVVHVVPDNPGEEASVRHHNDATLRSLSEELQELVHARWHVLLARGPPLLSEIFHALPAAQPWHAVEEFRLSRTLIACRAPSLSTKWSHQKPGVLQRAVQGTSRLHGTCQR
eukprot:CAMPEP_0194503120 /NCGR_PEP_ID=MMETSP0253-20130528/28204_1 /TAXON_ID=2966 /ORGANISM="Noctiluca scintillans" /LENGTH=114 /DNA_ID=CAMNT_0039345371 /DNA_START=262 /DNA_END=606 /DNA_ORIENTATION=-